MAREKMVTRTVKQTVIKALCVDIPKAQAMSECYTLSGIYTDKVQMLHKLQELYGNKDFAVVAVQEYSHKEQLYGMTEADFLKYAVELSDRFERI